MNATSHELLRILVTGASDVIGQAICPVCGESFSGDQEERAKVTCSSCGAPHHQDCWDFGVALLGGGCAMAIPLSTRIRDREVDQLRSRTQSTIKIFRSLPEKEGGAS